MGAFNSWKDVLEAAKRGEKLFYRAPLDVMAISFVPRDAFKRSNTYEARGRTIKMFPPGSAGRGRLRTSDPFTADAGHLDRFSSSGSGEPRVMSSGNWAAPSLPPGTSRG